MSKTVPDIATPSPVPIPIETQEKLLKIVMRRQATLSLSVAAFFLAPLLALPWINLSQSAFMNSRLLGFSVTWLILGICSFPLTWLISAYFVHTKQGAAAGMLTGGLLSLAAIVCSMAINKKWLVWEVHPQIRTLMEQPAIWGVPLLIAIMVVVSLATARYIPKDVALKMLRLHAPEELGVSKNYIEAEGDH